MRTRAKVESQMIAHKGAPCKGRVLMTRKQEDKRTIIFMKDKRTSPMQGTSTYDREEREDKMTTKNEDKRKIYMRTSGQDNKRSKRTREKKQNTRAR